MSIHDHGCGTVQAFKMILADALEMPIDLIRMGEADTCLLYTSRQSEVREGRGGWSVRWWGCAFFSCQHFNGFGKALAEKLHDKINEMCIRDRSCTV